MSTGPQVDHFVEVEFQEGREESSLKPRPGVLGIGHDGYGPLFGEVVDADIGLPAFTYRTYRVDGNLDLDKMQQMGLLLDMGGNGRMVTVPADQIRLALRKLPRPVAALQPGDAVTLLRNPEHPAWKKPALVSDPNLYVVPEDFESTIVPYVLPKDFEPIIIEGATIIERRDDKVLTHTGLWYGPDGLQDGSEATRIESATSLAGTRLSREVMKPGSPIARRQTVGTGRPQGEKNSQNSPSDSRYQQVQSGIDLLRSTVNQWNPHHPTQAKRIKFYSAIADQHQSNLDAFREVGTGCDHEQFNQMADDLDSHLRAAGVRRTAHPYRSSEAGAQTTIRERRLAALRAEKDCKADNVDTEQGVEIG